MDAIPGSCAISAASTGGWSRSTVITSQLPVDRWHEVTGDPTYADGILDSVGDFANTKAAPAPAGEPAWSAECLCRSLVSTLDDLNVEAYALRFNVEGGVHSWTLHGRPNCAYNWQPRS